MMAPTKLLYSNIINFKCGFQQHKAVSVGWSLNLLPLKRLYEKLNIANSADLFFLKSEKDQVRYHDG